MSNLPVAVIEALREAGRETGRLGGLKRARNMTAKERRASALKASKAAAAARTKRAKLKRVANV
jgi:hypothetical protein